MLLCCFKYINILYFLYEKPCERNFHFQSWIRNKTWFNNSVSISVPCLKKYVWISTFVCFHLKQIIMDKISGVSVCKNKKKTNNNNGVLRKTIFQHSGFQIKYFNVKISLTILKYLVKKCTLCVKARPFHIRFYCIRISNKTCHVSKRFTHCSRE